MKRSSIQLSQVEQLAQLWQCDAGSVGSWEESDSSAVLNHLLNTPLLEELAVLAEHLPEKLANVASASTTFADVLTADAPPLMLLRLIKRYSKRTSKDGSLPKDVAHLLYCVSIAAALVRCEQRITSGDDALLLANLAWASDRNWIDPTLKTLLDKAYAMVANANPADNSSRRDD